MEKTTPIANQHKTQSFFLPFMLRVFGGCRDEQDSWYCLGIAIPMSKNWYWNWYCLRAFWWSGIGIGIVYTGFKELVCLGIGIGIVYTMSEKLVLELELFNLRLKNWYELALELELFKQ